MEADMNPDMNPDTETRDRIRDLLTTGHTPREIAAKLDITTQAVYAHMKKLRGTAA